MSTNPGLYVRDAAVDTHDGTINVPVLLGGPAGTASGSTVTVHYATHDATAVAGTDYTAASGTLTFGPGQTVQNVPIAITTRAGAAPARRFSLTLTSPVNATLIDATGVIAIAASGGTAVATPAINAPADVVVGQGDGYLDVPVTLAAAGSSTVTVGYATTTVSSGSGPCNNLMRAVAGTLTFTARGDQPNRAGRSERLPRGGVLLVHLRPVRPDERHHRAAADPGRDRR